MKTKIAALTVLLFAGAATAALAQEDRDRGERRGEARAEHPATPVPRAAPEFRQDRPDRPAPVAQPRSEPAQQAEPPRRSEGGRPEGWRGGEGRRGGGGPDAQPQPQPQPQAPPQPRADGERRWQGRDGQTVQNRGGQGRDGQGRDGQNRDGQNRDGQNRDGQNRDGQGRGGWDGQRHDGDRNTGDRSDNNRRGGDRNGGRWDQNDVRHGGDRRDNNRHDGDRNNGGRWDDHGRPHWDHNRYPPVYRSSHRYQHYWRPPIGFYAYNWGFGDILPAAWYTPEYRLYDWWSYDLPAPPPGYSWVRVGYDAILVDDFDGRVVQVVRLVFY